MRATSQLLLLGSITTRGDDEEMTTMYDTHWKAMKTRSTTKKTMKNDNYFTNDNKSDKL